jgi:hypothetical protein
MSNVMIGGADDFDPSTLEFGIGSHKFVISRANFETDMVESWLGTEFFSGDSVYLEEEEFMMGTARGKEGGPGHITWYFMEAECLFIETTGAFEVRDKENNVAEFMDFHRGIMIME